MREFSFNCPVRIIFGNGARHRIADEIRGRYHKALLVCGKGPFRENGLYDDIRTELLSGGLEVLSMNDIDSNPRISSVEEGAGICRENGVDLVVALGGGSTMDCSKVIAATACTNDDPRDYLWGKNGEKKIFSASIDTLLIPTMASTGTELNNTAVIMNPEMISKTYCEADCLFSAYTVIDPEIAVNVPLRMTIWAGMDILSHIFEYYFNGNGDCIFQPYFSEALIISAMKAIELLASDPHDVWARGELAWISVMAWGGLTKIGRGGPDMSCHTIGEQLVPYFNIHHGATMGVATSRWMRFVHDKRPDVYSRFSRNVLGIDDPDDASASEKGFQMYMDWLRKIGAPDTLTELIGNRPDDKLLREIAERTIRENGTVGTLVEMSADDIFEIYKDMCEPFLYAGGR